jgi:hypothetical protein
VVEGKVLKNLLKPPSETAPLKMIFIGWPPQANEGGQSLFFTQTERMSHVSFEKTSWRRNYYHGR